MNLGRKLYLGAGGLLLALAVQADVAEPKETPYKVILERNPFGLKDPPPATATPTNPVSPPITIKLTGITSNSGGKKAWLMIPPQPGKSQTPQYLSIPEKDKQGDIEVVEINEQESTVRILNAGVAATLNFKEHGLAAPAAMPVPGAPGIPTPRGPTPLVRPASGTPYNAPVPAPSYTANPSPAAANTALRTIPARNVRTTPIEPQPQANPVVTPEAQQDELAVQYLKLKLSEQRAIQEGRPHPPIPPLPGAPQ